MDREQRSSPELIVTVTIEEAHAKLPMLIAQLGAGEELVITQNELPIARLVAEPNPSRKPRRPGSAKGLLTIISDDEEHLADFAEYMQ
jgi:antitoxin (DNA-binding transcriptional repressor) of toxin-antitoxin stability system